MFLDKRSPAYLGGSLEMLGVRMYRHWSDLTEALRTGQPQNETKHTGRPLFEELSHDPAKLEQFMLAMAGAQLSNFHALAEKFDFTRYRTLCDVGGATGQLCTIIAGRYPNLRCTSFDLPVVTPIAKKAIVAAGLADRVDTASGDFFTDSFPRADCRHDGKYPARLEPGPEVAPDPLGVCGPSRGRRLHRHRGHH